MDEWEGLETEQECRRMRAWMLRKCTLRYGGSISASYRGMDRKKRLPCKHQKENARILIHESLNTSSQSPNSFFQNKEAISMLNEGVRREVSGSVTVGVLRRSHAIPTACSVKSPLRCCHQHCSTDAQSAW